MKKLATMFEEELNWQVFKQPIIDIYSKHFTEEVRGPITLMNPRLVKV